MAKNRKVMFIFGTRPEAIKFAPLILKMQKTDGLDVIVCVTGQHREMLYQVLELFNIEPDFDLSVMKTSQTLAEITIAIIKKIEQVLLNVKPDLILVHGDTTTSFTASLSAFYNQIQVGHVEAGLRTGSKFSPFPEEMNRKLTAHLADIHFAPTETSKQNLLDEGINKGKIFVTGNTVIDSLLTVLDLINDNEQLKAKIIETLREVPLSKQILLVTGHRRENFGEGLQQICNALKNLAQKFDKLHIVYPVHLNPKVKGPVTKLLAETPNIYLINPLDYLSFVYLMSKSKIILTDSGGIQEEAPTLGKPILLTRETTERPEAVITGTAKIVGTDAKTIFDEVSKLMLDKKYYDQMSLKINPYGDGHSSELIIKIIKEKMV